ncbi:MAG: VWA domain-containing protein [Myxococcales bacterium]
METGVSEKLRVGRGALVGLIALGVLSCSRKAASEKVAVSEQNAPSSATATAAPLAAFADKDDQANFGMMGPMGASGGGGGKGRSAPGESQGLGIGAAGYPRAASPAPLAIPQKPGAAGPAGPAAVAPSLPAAPPVREALPRQVSVSVSAPRLDPNARYATTYRPGGAALAAFDSALARGSIPAVYKDVVGDFAAKYAPTMARPSGAAMAFLVDTERTAVSPSGGTLNLRIAMRSTDAMPTRAPLSVHLVLDVSGSMSGPAIDNARKAAEALVAKLDPADDFSMITFSSDAQVLVADGPIGARRPGVVAKIREVKAEGGTNLSAGLDLGYKQAHTPSIVQDAVKIVMLLSDGHANAGDTTQSGIAGRSAQAFQDGIQTSTFGLGADFDAPLMATIADRGAGAYYYLADSAQISPALTREFESRLVPVAQAVEVRVRLRPDVAPTKVFGSRELSETEAWQVRQQEVAVDRQTQQRDAIRQDRQQDATGGMRFFMPTFARDDRHAMLLTLTLPAGSGERPIASVEIRYKDRIAKKNVTQEIPVRIRYAASDAESATTANAGVVRTVQAFSAGDTVMMAAELVDRGDRAGAAKILQERAELLSRAAEVLKEPAFAEDSQRLGRLASAVNGGERIADAVPLAVLLRGSGYGYLR